MTKTQQDLSYCFKPDCQQPKNNSDAAECQCCGSLLLLQNRYRAVKLIAKSDRERTFKAVDTWKEKDDSYCVIQQYLSSPDKIENVTELLAIESEKFKKINEHRQVPNILEYFSEAGYQYVIREFIEGHRISQELAAYGAFKESEIKELLLDLLPILKFIHSYGIVHGNIRPENIVRRQKDRRLVLVNFTLPFIKNHSSYSPPEQISDRPIYASDIYSLGITCTHLLTQIKPEKLFKDPADIKMWADCLICKNLLSESLAEVINRMIRIYPEREYCSIKEIIKDLRPALKIPVILPPKSVIIGGAIVAGLITTRYISTPTGQEIAGNNDKSNLIDTTNNLAAKNPLQTPSLNAILSSNIDGNKENLPLEDTKITAKISHNFSVTEIKQTFFNPYARPIEAVYEFSLPEEAVINNMKIKSGTRTLKSKIERKKTAIAKFKTAKKELKTTAILQQDRNNIYTESVSNILPGEKIEIAISYSKDIKFKNGQYQYRFPMSIVPHQKQEKAKQNIDITVEIEREKIEKIESPTHKIAVRRKDLGAEVNLAKEINPSERDFILNYRVISPKIKETVSTQTSERGAYFLARLNPAEKYNNREIVPKDIVFLIDTSGSQLGYPLEQSRELMRSFINRLNHQDRFTIINFASEIDKLSNRPLNNTAKNRKKALAYIDRLQASGRTELMKGIDKVLNLPSPPEGRLRAIILISDGSSNNSKQIVAKAQKQLKPGNRFYTFAVGPSSEDRFLINRLAQLGRGTATIVPPQAEASQIVDEFITEIDEPILTNVKANWLGSGEKPEIYPAILPDLFADRPISLYGHKSDRVSGQLKITGTLAKGENYERIIDINFDNTDNKDDSLSDDLSEQIPQLWGSAKVKNLIALTRSNDNEVEGETATNTALKYKIISKFTAFIAVGEPEENSEEFEEDFSADSSEIDEGGEE